MYHDAGGRVAVSSIDTDDGGRPSAARAVPLPQRIFGVTRPPAPALQRDGRSATPLLHVLRHTIDLLLR